MRRRCNGCLQTLRESGWWLAPSRYAPAGSAHYLAQIMDWSQHQIMIIQFFGMIIHVFEMILDRRGPFRCCLMARRFMASDVGCRV